MRQVKLGKIYNFINLEDIISKVCEGREIIGYLNSLWYDKNISMETKNQSEKAMVESHTCYKCEVRTFKREK